MNILIVVLGQLPEAIFFALFMILAKNIKKKRLLFTGLMCLEYVLIMMLFQYNWLFHIIYTIMTFLTLKVLYKENAQITDIFILMISYIILIVTSAICAVLFNSNLVIATIINRIKIYPGDTVQDVLIDNPKGTYLVTMNGHITVIKDGIVYDTFDCRDREIWNAWKVK